MEFCFAIFPIAKEIRQNLFTFNEDLNEILVSKTQEFENIKHLPGSWQIMGPGILAKIMEGSQ